jgi:hypothetical protein
VSEAKRIRKDEDKAANVETIDNASSMEKISEAKVIRKVKKRIKKLSKEVGEMASISTSIGSSSRSRNRQRFLAKSSSVPLDMKYSH